MCEETCLKQERAWLGGKDYFDIDRMVLPTAANDPVVLVHARALLTAST